MNDYVGYPFNNASNFNEDCDKDNDDDAMLSELRKYANRHVSKFLSLEEIDIDSYDIHTGVSARTSTISDADNDNTTDPIIQVIHDGRKLTTKRLLKHSYKKTQQSLASDSALTSDSALAPAPTENYDKNDSLSLSRPILVKDTPESIGMTVLSFPNRQVAVRDIANIIGYNFPVRVIDVEHQEELEGWAMADLVDYFEDDERLLRQHQQETARLLMASKSNHSATTESATSTSAPANQRTQRRRKAAQKCIITTNSQRPRVLNQISLEFSATPLRKQIQSPKFVRDIDWIDHAWPKTTTTPNNNNTTNNENTPPRVQYYCLTSAAGCYTDFHVDFGGTSVWYHILSGEKDFCLIPPTDENLATYEDWLCRPNQADIFLPDMIQDPKNNVIRVSLQASQTLIIPTAWIHAVYTPTDSVVIGGNFLHGLDIPLQLKVHCLESRTRVQEKFRFPHFLPINFYAGGMYLQKLRAGDVVPREVEGLGELIDSLEEWWKVQQGQSQLQSGTTVVGAAEECAARNKCSSVQEFLRELRNELQRVTTHGIVPNPNYTPPPSPANNKIKLKLKINNKSSSSSNNNNITGTSNGSAINNTRGPLPMAPQPKPPTTTTTTTTTTPSPSATVSESSSNGDDNDQFRIVLSSSALKSNAPIPAPSQRLSKRAREDTDWMYDPTAVDDEWVPSSSTTTTNNNNKKKVTNSSSRKKKASNATTTTATATGGGKGKTITGGSSSASKSTPTPTKGQAKSQKPKMSARERLMKRFR